MSRASARPACCQAAGPGQVEQEEEFITNKLMKRLEQLKNEKQTLANEVEQEEEYLINNLQKRLTKVHTEKVDLEKQLETEQEYIVNKLQKKVRCWQACMQQRCRGSC